MPGVAAACQLRVVEGLTAFSSMSLPCFSPKAFALLASIESSQGSCTLSLTWSSATSIVPVGHRRDHRLGRGHRNQAPETTSA
jgi:hypothetical protein